MTVRDGSRSKISQAIAFIRWVFPSPTPPYKKSGLKDTEDARFSNCLNVQGAMVPRIGLQSPGGQAFQGDRGPGWMWLISGDRVTKRSRPIPAHAQDALFVPIFRVHRGHSEEAGGEKWAVD